MRWIQKRSIELFGLGTGRNKRTWRCVELGKGLLNGLRVATKQTEGGYWSDCGRRETNCFGDVTFKIPFYSTYNSVSLLSSFEQ